MRSRCAAPSAATSSGPAPTGGPVLLIGGGSGIAPLVSMLRHRMMASGMWVPMLMLFSARTWDEVIFRDELLGYEAMRQRLRRRLHDHPRGRSSAPATTLAASMRR